MAKTARRREAGAFENWPVKRSRGGRLGLAAAAVLLVLGAAALAWAARQAIDPLSLAIIVVAALAVGAGLAVGVAALGFYRLRYRFGPGQLVVCWAGPPETVRLEEIDGIYAGQRAGELRSVRGLSWPGYHVGVVRSRTMGTLRVFCTDRDPEALSVIVTPSRTLVLSPHDPPAFRRELIRRIEAGETPASSSANAPLNGRLAWPHPLIAGLLGVALALFAAIVVALATGYSGLPEMIALQPEPSGQPAPLSPRAEILNFPLLAGGLLLLNVVLAAALRGRERGTSVLLCGTAGLIQIIVLLATLRLLP